MTRNEARQGTAEMTNGRCDHRQNYFYLHGPDYVWVFGVSIRDTIGKLRTFDEAEDVALAWRELFQWITPDKLRRLIERQ